MENSGYLLQNLQSSVFRVEPTQDYSDIKLDLKSNKNLMTEYQSQDFFDSTQKQQSLDRQPPRMNDQKVRIHQKSGLRKGLPSMPKRHRNTGQLLTTSTSTEQRILGILD